MTTPVVAFLGFAPRAWWRGFWFLAQVRSVVNKNNTKLAAKWLLHAQCP